MLARALAACAAALVLALAAAAPLAAPAAADPRPAPIRFPIRVKGKWGFIDARGKVKVPAIYDEVGEYDQGRALVTRAKQVGVIDQHGELLVPIAYQLLGGFAGERHAAVAADGTCGYLDGAGAWAFRLDDCADVRLDDFSDGLAALVGPRQTRYVDPAGNVVITVEGKGSLFLHGVAVVERDGKQRPIDRTGKELALPAGADTFTGSFWDGMPAPIMIGRTCKRGLCFGPWGLVDPSMKVVIAPQYRMPPHFEDGLAAVVVDFDPGYGYIDPTGALAIAHQYKWAEGFSEGLAWVEDQTAATP